jgi:hypothetical protein
LHAKISARRKNFVLLCRTVGFENLIQQISLNNGNRAHKKRIPQYTGSSISKQVNIIFSQAPSASRRDAAAGIS